MAGAKGRSGGKREGSGRKAGVPNKSTAAIKAAAMPHGEAAIACLVKIMNKSDSDQARIAACKEILDRAYGKPAQAIEHSGEMHMTHEDRLAELERLEAAELAATAGQQIN